MPFNYNTQGITNPDANDPRNLGGSSGIMSSTANTTSNDDDNEPSFFESIANLFSGAGADLPSDNNDDGDSGASFYSGPMFGPFNNGSDDSGSDNNSSSTSPTNKPLPTSAADRAVYEALGIDVPEVYKGELGEWEAEPNINMDVLQKALQPDPIAVEEIEVKAGDTLSGIAKDKGVPVQDVINANPQIKNPDLIRPGEKVTVPDVYSGESTMERMARESAELAASKRDAAGITRSLTPEEVKKRNAALKADSEDPDRKFYQSTIPIEDRTFPAEAEQADGIMSPTNLSSRLDTKGSKVTKYDSLLFETGTEQVKGVQGVLTQLGYVPRGIDGIMGDGTRSALRNYQEANNLTVTGEIDDETLTSLKDSKKEKFVFSDATNALYDNYTVDGIEGEDHHLGGADYLRVGITLEGGIVPDSGLKYMHNGTVITLPNDRSTRWNVLSNAGVTLDNFNTDNVIMDDVVKSGVKRSDYKSDEEFTKAVLTSFQDKAKDKLVEEGYSREDFDADALKTIGDLAWNAGVDPIGWTSMEPVLEELAKPLAQRDTQRMQGLLDTAPTSDGKILGGVMKRRAIQYNWSVPDDKKITRVTSSAATGEGTYYFADGTTKVITRTKGADTQDESVPQL